ncbi:16S rRNA (cytosine(1402)-N(4))-methyltransferase RsmH [Agrilactobacillus fermenti]|uniref:16S rRNA (cytosine(1402)-N(4))-methyltransferase RsmH n=1 Tax=Agrilactobacillus fermenti TaxID=2586909 RepID=UPI001E5E1EFC|nr:16S rRNA (cytosine(1402)-N(4))-methyltransferase RsmH [Agrilactobacillus fermenti]MCD2255317.1 16S rRNA (cytosine(1402)-N(4))-methyltransferase RsmH [Agrilactobacillus fermenti]
MADFKHVTVLLEETVKMLAIDPDGIYVDATLGGGGHTNLILQQLDQGHLFAFDQDQVAIDHAKARFKTALAKNQLTLIHDNFANLRSALAKHEITAIDGIAYDLGVSSPQFDDAKRGFSYKLTAPLDMRMDTSQALTARTVVNEWDFSRLQKIIARYGEERFAKRIARAIEKRRAIQPIETTTELAEIVKDAIPAATRRTGGHPAKRTFQAIRIAVNDEMAVLESTLKQAVTLLKPEGRIAVITFQSLEDRIVAGYFKDLSRMPDLPRGLPIIPDDKKPILKIVTRKPILPDQQEQTGNHRAHSARLRVAEKN